MKPVFALLMICSTFAVSSARAEDSVTSVIQVKPVVEIESGQSDIMLSDLIATHGLSRTAIEQLRTVRMADAPKAGEERSFTDFGLNDTMAPYLEQISKKTGEKFTLKIPSRVVVSRKRLHFQAQDVEAALRKSFGVLCVDCHFEISNLSIPQIAASSSITSWQLRAQPELPKGSFSIPLDVTTNGAAARTYWVNGMLATRKTVPVLSRAVNSGDRLQPEDFTLQEKDVTFATDTAATETEIKSTVASRGLAAGQILWRSSLRRELAIKNGDIVKVTAGNTEWQIIIDGVAQTSGYIGDLVKVKIPKTQKMVSGLLTERGQVEVRE